MVALPLALRDEIHPNLPHVSTGAAHELRNDIQSAGLHKEVGERLIHGERVGSLEEQRSGNALLRVAVCADRREEPEADIRKLLGGVHTEAGGIDDRDPRLTVQRDSASGFVLNVDFSVHANPPSLRLTVSTR